MPAPRYRLVDGEAQHRAHPDTFEIPSAKERRGVRAGNMVKLGFLILAPTDEYRDERMWVAVAGTRGKSYFGTLCNEPSHDVGAVLEDTIVFDSRNILKIAEDADDVERQALLQSGVIVGRRIWQDGAYPGWLQRGEPANESDSGWVMMAGDEDEAYANDLDNLRVIPLMVLLNGAPPALAHLLLTAEEGTEWSWNAETERYDPVSKDDEPDGADG